MTLAPKTRLGEFEIRSHLASGGMGHVYIAWDSVLKREVAIKVLPDSVAKDKDRVSRFEREARLLATINHPNIAAIYRHDRQEGMLYLVLELVEGRTLGELISGTVLPWRKTLALFRQIALALEAAHSHRIIHRDLKPENVKVTDEGVVKVLDFGLAKELLDDASLSGTNKRTKTAPSNLTRPGDRMGTPLYWSPEQSQGLPLDQRTDVWSFGCCLFEALAGRHPFAESAEVDLGALPSGLPRNVRDLLRRCLQKDSKLRLADMRYVRLEIEAALGAPEEAEPSRIKPVHWVGGMGAAAVVGLLLGRFPGASPPSEPVRRFEILLPESEPVLLGRGPALALSPDGLRLVYVARHRDTGILRSRAMERLDPAELPGTEGASQPSFSPSGNDIAFFSQNRLQRMSLESLSLRPLAESSNSRGASWVTDTSILFAPEAVSGIYFLDAGSAPNLWIEPSEEEGEQSLRWPSVLPGGAHALFTRVTDKGFDVEVASLRDATRTRLLENASSARYAPTNHLVFVRDDALQAAPFDLDHLATTGEPVPVVERVHRDPLTGAAFYDFSDEGTLVYVPSADFPADEVVGRLVRVSRQGKVATLPCPARAYQVPRLSRLGREVLVTISADTTDVWICELERGSLSRVTVEGNNGAALWTHGARQITFSSDRDGFWSLYSSAGDSTAPAKRLLAAENAHFATSWTPDGGELLFTEINEDNHDVWIYSMSTGRAKPFLDSSFDESAAVCSPDGRFVAYVSNETGEDEVYVRSYPEGTNKVPISIGGGREPVWDPDGTEIYYRGQLGMMAVPIETRPDLRPGKPEFLFEDSFDKAGALYASYDVTSDGEGFIMVRSDDELSSTRIHVVLNWFKELATRVPVER